MALSGELQAQLLTGIEQPDAVSLKLHRIEAFRDTVCNYLTIDLASRGLGQMRLKHIHLTFNAGIVPVLC